jgi:hypothetical protein
VGTFGGGVARLDGDTFTRFGQEQGVIDQTIYTLSPGAAGSLWMGTHGGLVRWRAGRFSSYTTDDGLPDNCVVQLLEDGNGFLWAGTRSGLCRIAITSLDVRIGTMRWSVWCLTNTMVCRRSFRGRGSLACTALRDGRLGRTAVLRFIVGRHIVPPPASGNDRGSAGDGQPCHLPLMPISQLLKFWDISSPPLKHQRD